MSKERFAAATDVSRETLECLEFYAEKLTKWNKAINLVAKPTLDDIWTRHFFDSAQLLDFIPSTACSLADIGSGAGFPGLVVAILRPDLKVSLIESDQRKAVFLRETARACSADVAIYVDRAEAVDLTADIVSARAVTSLSNLLEMTENLLALGGVALFLKGAQVENELTEANRVWHITHTQHDSRADPRGTVLSITGFHRRTGL